MAGDDGRSEIRDRAEKKHKDLQAVRDFMAGGQRSETEQRRSTGTYILNELSQRSETELRRKKSTGTHKLEGISWQEIRNQRQS